MTIGHDIQIYLRDKGLYTGPIDDDFRDGTKIAIAKALGLHSVAAPSGMTISPAGLALIKQFEGLELKAYLCPAEVWTIGYGSTGPHVKPGMVITEAQADEMLRKDVERFDAAVRKLCPISTQGQHDALVSFAFNLGENALKESSLRRLHNEGAWEAAAGQFSRWINANGKPLAGLVKRRAAEAKMYRGQT
jgi:lysozyme